jgi:hypothetical protein
MNAFERIAVEFRDNPRFRIGLWIVIAILWGYGLLEASDALQRRETALGDLRQRISEARVLVRGPDWEGRRVEAQGRLAAFEGSLPSESTSSLAEANLRDWLSQAATRAGVSVRELSLGAPPGTKAETTPPPPGGTAAPQAQGVMVVRAKLAFDFQRRALAALLAEFERADRPIVIDRLLVRNAPQRPSVEIELHTAYRIDRAKRS